MTQELKAGMWVQWGKDKCWLIGHDPDGNAWVIVNGATMPTLVYDEHITPWREKRTVTVPDVWVYEHLCNDAAFVFSSLNKVSDAKLIHHYPSFTKEVDE